MTFQPAPVMYPDAELLLTGAFRAELVAAGEVGVTVARKIPNPRTSRMVIITRDGGAVGELRDRPRVRIRVWDTTDQKATDLARRVVAIGLGLPLGGYVLRAEHLSGPYDVADASETPQRYVLFEFHTRGVSP
ncbi:MAG: hypothetical protein H0X12_11160 [Nocardioides sp.]|nr:hypothetical protein [Nocardioides sp.]